MSDFSAALAIKPDMISAYKGRAEAHAAQQRFAEAASDYSAALAIKPDIIWAYKARANALERLGHKEAAAADRERASELR